MKTKRIKRIKRNHHLFSLLGLSYIYKCKKSKNRNKASLLLLLIYWSFSASVASFSSPFAFAETPKESSTSQNQDISFLETYPLYPLREDLGEFLVKDEKESVESSIKSVEFFIKRRFKEEGIKGRGDHMKAHACYPSSFEILSQLPEEYSQGITRPVNQGTRFSSIVRFSNSENTKVPDKLSASLGFATKVFLLQKHTKDEYLFPEDPESEEQQDFLMGSSHVFFSKDIKEYSKLFKARGEGGLLNTLSIAFRYPKVLWKRKIQPRLRSHNKMPLFLEKRFWSSTPYAWGNRASKYTLIPCHSFQRSQVTGKGKKNAKAFFANPSYQTVALEETLKNQDICYDFAVQLRPLPSEGMTEKQINKKYPIESLNVFWPEKEKGGTPFVKVAQIRVSKGTQPISQEICNKLRFNPWSGLKTHQPLSNLNRSRLVVYKKSAEIRRKLHQVGSHYYDGSFKTFKDYVLKTFFGLPVWLNDNGKLVLKLSEEREELFHKNLFDTGVAENEETLDCRTVMKTPHRTPEGRCYFYQVESDMGKMVTESNRGKVGSKGTRFGRNTSSFTDEQVKEMEKNLLVPNPRLISQRLFTRKNGMIPAKTLNLLAGAWLQAQNHDWFSHGKNVAPIAKGTDSNATDATDATDATKAHLDKTSQQRATSWLKVPPVNGDTIFPQGMLIPRTQPDLTQIPSGKGGYQKTFNNMVTNWWDASQIYGSDIATIKKVRTNPLTGELLPHGKIAVDEKNRRLYYGKDGVPITGFSDNWWIGLELIHSLFAMEHNAVVDQLMESNPSMSDEELFQKARLVVAALIAKIHTIEWTPALLDNKALHVGMRSNWHGMAEPLKVLNNSIAKSLIKSLSDRFRHAVYGITGKDSLALYEVPFTLTEEFVSVYRMHPLIPDYFEVYQKGSRDPRQARKVVSIEESRDEKVRNLIHYDHSPYSSMEIMYSMGRNHPGALILHNYPKFMQNIKVKRNTVGIPEVHFDLAALDIIRDRERLVPRYNEFRRQLRLKPIKTFDDLTSNKEDVELLKEVYNNDVEKLDLIVGSLAEEDRYENFAFGNTPFYIFALMASRRLLADPFYSDYFSPEVYTQLGYDWVQNTTMKDVILRHYPELKEAFQDVVNAFQPWQDGVLEQNSK